MNVFTPIIDVGILNILISFSLVNDITCQLVSPSNSFINTSTDKISVLPLNFWIGLLKSARFHNPIECSSLQTVIIPSPKG